MAKGQRAIAPTDVSEGSENEEPPKKRVFARKKATAKSKNAPDDAAVATPTAKVKGLDFSKPLIVSCEEMFEHMVRNAISLNLPGAIETIDREIHVGTMCSGTESPILALNMIRLMLQNMGMVPLKFVHRFSAEIIPFKQGYINSNFKPALLFQDITEFHPKPKAAATEDIDALVEDEDEDMEDDAKAGATEGEGGATEAVAGPSTPKAAAKPKGKKTAEVVFDRSMFEDPEGTTVYGKKEKVPLDIDMLIAGSSCVDFSSLNIKKINDPKERESGQSAQTFLAIVAYCQYAETPMVILENVKNTAAWKKLQSAFEQIGYHCVWTTCDSKDYYLPQTRQRGYMVCLNKAGFERKNLDTSVFENVDWTNQWKELVKRFQYRASASVSDFLLTQNQLEALSIHPEKAGAGARVALSWENARGRHASVRQQYQLGAQSPMIQNPPEYVHQLMCIRPHREKDVLSIRRLQAASKGADDLYKMYTIDLTQNVDRAQNVKASGIAGCITPRGALYLTNSVRLVSGHETLILQGLPMDMIKFTTQTDMEKRDLAGNAMSSPVVGAVILSSLIACFGKPSSMEVDPKDVLSGEEISSGNDFQRTGRLLKQSLTARDFFAADLQKIISEASSTAQKCRCEGPREVVRCKILVCRVCHHSVCEKCAGDPPHEFDSQDRACTLSPRDFEYKWSAYFHRAITLHWAEQIDNMIQGSVIDQHAFVDYREHVMKALGGLFTFQSFHRERHWIVEWKSPYARLELVLEQPLRWVLRIDPDPKWPGNSVMRRTFARIFARKESDNLDFDRLGEGWQIFVPNAVKFTLKCAASDQKHPSWRNNLGLVKFQEENVYSQLQVKVQNDASLMPGDFDQFNKLSGTYQHRPNCGTAASCLYQNIDDGSKTGNKMCLFLDPHPIGVPELDTFVFSTNPLRIDFGETREIEGSLSEEWRPWGSKRSIESTTLESTGYWVDVGFLETTVAAVRTEVAIAGKNHFDMLSRADCKDQEVIAIFNVVPNFPSPFELVGSYQGITRSVRSYIKVFTYALTQQTDEFDHANEWQSFSDPHESEKCYECSPPLPAVEWTGEKGKNSCLMNVIDASDFERRMRSRPPVLNFSYSFADGSNPTLTVGVRIVSLAHRAKACLGATHAELSWKLDFKALDVPDIHTVAFKLKNNSDNEAAVPPAGMKVKLRDDQLRSLRWMKEQESGRGVEFLRQEIEEAFVPEMRVKLSVKASTPVYIRGGILADKPSYGKTACVIALIHDEHLAGVEADDEEYPDSAPNVASSEASSSGGAISGRLDKGKGKALDNPSPQSVVCDKTADTRAYKTNATLICVSSEVAEQWLSEFSKFLSPSSRDHIEICLIKTAQDLKRMPVHRIMQANVVIVTWQAIGAGYEKLLVEKSEEPMPWGNSTRHYREWLVRALAKLNAKAAQGQKADGKSKGKGRAARDSDEPAIIHLFRWNRIVIDEYALLVTGSRSPTTTERLFALTESICADKRWLLSGTPPMTDFHDVYCSAKLLGFNLGRTNLTPGTIKSRTRFRIFDDLSMTEKFLCFEETKSPGWHNTRREHAQHFLHTFARQNEPDLGHIKLHESLIPLTLTPIHGALHDELLHHLLDNNFRVDRKDLGFVKKKAANAPAAQADGDDAKAPKKRGSKKKAAKADELADDDQADNTWMSSVIDSGKAAEVVLVNAAIDIDYVESTLGGDDDSYEKLAVIREKELDKAEETLKTALLEAKTILEAAKAADDAEKALTAPTPAPDATSTKKRKRSAKTNAGTAAKDLAEKSLRFRSWTLEDRGDADSRSRIGQLLAQAFPGADWAEILGPGLETAGAARVARATDGDDSDGDDEDDEGGDVSAPSAACKMQRHIEEHLRPGARRFVAAHQRRRYAGTLAILFGAGQDVVQQELRFWHQLYELSIQLVSKS